MAKTVAIGDDAHAIIADIQSKIKEKHGINLKISYLVDSTITNFARKMEEILENKFDGITGKDAIDEEKVEAKLGTGRREMPILEESS